MNILWLKEALNKRELIGNKCLLLAELSTRGFPVPQGFCITSEAFNLFLKENNIKDEILNIIKENPAEEASKKIRSLLVSKEIPRHLEKEILEAYDNLNVDESLINNASKDALDIIKLGREPVFVALRISTPFKLKTFYSLNIKGNADLRDSINKAIINSFTPEFVNKIKYLEMIPLSMIIQKMINSKKSGTMEVKDNEIHIKANFGFSSTVVNNEVVPDYYNINKNSLEVNQKIINNKEFMLTKTSRGETVKKPLENMSNQQVLDLYDLNKLSNLALNIDSYKENQEIEWTIEEGRPYVIDLKENKIELPETKLGLILEVQNPHNIPQPGRDIPEEIEDLEITEIETTTHVKLLLNNYGEFELLPVNCDGIGLLRSELLVNPELSNEDITNIITEKLEAIASRFREKPVWYRTLDYSDENDKNPLVGYRGIRKSLDNVETLKAEFRAVKNLHDKGFTNIGITLPLITDVSQIRKAKDILREVGLEPLDEIEFGIMIETPASCIIIDDICREGIDFINFGLHDLTESTLHVDRKNVRTSDIYNELHPAVLKEIKEVIKVCKQYNVETSVTIDNLDIVEFMVKYGADSITCPKDRVNEIIKIIDKVERKLLLDVARKDLE